MSLVERERARTQKYLSSLRSSYKREEKHSFAKFLIFDAEKYLTKRILNETKTSYGF